MRKEHYYLLTFNSTHYAIAAETYLSKTIPISIMPTLRKISASCGISIRIEPENFDEAVQLIDSNPKIKQKSIPYEIFGENIIRLSLKELV